MIGSTISNCPFSSGFVLTHPGTVAVVKKLVAEDGPSIAETQAPAATEPVIAETNPEANGINGTNGATKEDTAKAEVAADVADTAAKIDGDGSVPAVVAA